MCRHYVRGPSERLARHLRLTPPPVVVVAVARLGRPATRRARRRGGLYPQLFRAGALHKKAAPRKGPCGVGAARAVTAARRGRPAAARGAICSRRGGRARATAPPGDRPRRRGRRYAQNAVVAIGLCRPNVRNAAPRAERDRQWRVRKGFGRRELAGAAPFGPARLFFRARAFARREGFGTVSARRLV